jgi:hypothetical protein
VLLGNRGGACMERLGRCLVVWASGTASLAAGARLVAPAARHGWSVRRSWDLVPLDVALVDLAAVVLLLGAFWAWLALTATVAEAMVGTRRHDIPVGARPWRLPGRLRRLVLTGCGVALVSVALGPPAIASGHHHPRPDRDAVLTGLPLPDRAVANPAPHASRRTSRGPAAGTRSVVVRPGDCLWSIAAGELPPGAPTSAVARRWRAIYAANRPVIGPDPDVVVPGQRLLVPRSLPRKDPS